jgi:hypothetical protein
MAMKIDDNKIYLAGREVKVSKPAELVNGHFSVSGDAISQIVALHTGLNITSNIPIFTRNN